MIAAEFTPETGQGILVEDEGETILTFIWDDSDPALPNYDQVEAAMPIRLEELGYAPAFAENVALQLASIAN